MDEQCRNTHAKLIAGTCPWCGQAIIGGTPTADDWLEVQEQTDVLPEGDLKQLVDRQGGIPVKAAVRLLVRIATQLDEYHQLHGIHRLVCPTNIIVDDDGNPRLLPPTNLVLEAVDYISPELALSSHKADTRADIYSLGCTFYFLPTGCPPFPTGSVSEILLKHQLEVPPDLHDHRSDVPADIAAICSRMLAKKPQDRFQSAHEVLLAIEKWQRGASLG